MPGVPPTWEDVLSALAYLLGGRSGQFRAEAEEWLREAVTTSYAVESLHDLARPQRQLAFQRTLGVVHDLAGLGEIAFSLDVRRVVGAAFAARFACEAPPGPEWRLTPLELDLPTYRELDELAF